MRGINYDQVLINEEFNLNEEFGFNDIGNAFKGAANTVVSVANRAGHEIKKHGDRIGHEIKKGGDSTINQINKAQIGKELLKWSETVGNGLS